MMKMFIFTILSIVSCLFVSCKEDEKPTEMPEAKIGYYYYSDKSYSADLKADKTPIGIIFWLNPDNRSGKIVSLSEPVGDWDNGLAVNGDLEWQGFIHSEVIGASSKSDGKANTQSVNEWIKKNQDKTISNFPAFKWCAEYATAGKGKGEWYLPAYLELQQLYAAMSGLKWVVSNAGQKEIKDWGLEADMPNYDNYTEARKDFNALFTAPGVGGAIMAPDTDRYWSSTETHALFSYNVGYKTGNCRSDNKYSLYKVRAIATF